MATYMPTPPSHSLCGLHKAGIHAILAPERVTQAMYPVPIRVHPPPQVHCPLYGLTCVCVRA
eukprot:1158010-Pelagomonas_calceolata.AAC.3